MFQSLMIPLNNNHYQTGVISSACIQMINVSLLAEKYKEIAIVDEDEKAEITCNFTDDVYSFINLFDEMQSDNGKYFSRRLVEIYTAEEDLPFDVETFKGLYNFARNSIFDIMYVALGVDSNGHPILQQNLSDRYIHIKFLSSTIIQYRLVYGARDINSKGTFDEFYKDFATCPVFG